MAVDKRISVEPNEVGIGSIKRKKVEVIPFKPKPDSPFATPEGIFDLPKPKPEEATVADKVSGQCSGIASAFPLHRD